MLCCWRMCFARASERVKDLSHSVEVRLARVDTDELQRTWEGASEGFLAGMRADVGDEGKARGLWHTAPKTRCPFA